MSNDESVEDIWWDVDEVSESDHGYDSFKGKTGLKRESDQSTAVHVPIETSEIDLRNLVGLWLSVNQILV